MKKIAITVLAAAAVSTVGLVSAPFAVADPEPPVAPGAYHFNSRTVDDTLTAAYDCGPSCFSLTAPSVRWELRYDPVANNWHTGDGISTVDGHTFVNQHGKSGQLTPA
jgi:hypothetical protein